MLERMCTSWFKKPGKGAGCKDLPRVYKYEDNSNKYTKQLSNQFIFLLGSLGIGTAKVDRALALTNNKLRQPYSSATILALRCTFI